MKSGDQVRVIDYEKSTVDEIVTIVGTIEHMENGWALIQLTQPLRTQLYGNIWRIVRSLDHIISRSSHTIDWRKYGF